MVEFYSWSSFDFGWVFFCGWVLLHHDWLCSYLGWVSVLVEFRSSHDAVMAWRTFVMAWRPFVMAWRSSWHDGQSNLGWVLGFLLWGNLSQCNRKPPGHIPQLGAHSTLVQNNQKSGHEYQTSPSSICLFIHSTHFACTYYSARSHTNSQTCEKISDKMSQHHAILNHRAFYFHLQLTWALNTMWTPWGRMCEEWTMPRNSRMCSIFAS